MLLILSPGSRSGEVAFPWDAEVEEVKYFLRLKLNLAGSAEVWAKAKEPGLIDGRCDTCTGDRRSKQQVE